MTEKTIQSPETNEKHLFVIAEGDNQQNLITTISFAREKTEEDMLSVISHKKGPPTPSESVKRMLNRSREMDLAR